MKFLVVVTLNLVALQLNAYLIKGARTTISVEGPHKTNVTAISFEGCSKETCSKPQSKTDCFKEGPTKFYCHMKDKYPSFVRFTLNMGDKILSSQYIATNGEGVLSNFELTFSDSGQIILTPKH
jgi:hypothetical protein